MIGILDLFFPAHCMHCDKKLTFKSDVPICFNCEIQLDSALKDGLKNVFLLNRFKGVLPVKYGFSLYYFTNKGVSQTLIHEAKYQGQVYIFEHYGKILANYLASEKFHEFEKPDLLVVVPNNWWKKLKLSYNQAEVFGLGISKSLGIPLGKNILKKKRDKSSQTKRNKYDRLQKLQVLYYLSRNCDSVKNKHVLLIDDVITSGATIETCGQLLLEAGAKEVSICSFMLVK